MGILIDTDVLIEYLRGNETVVGNITGYYNLKKRLCFSPVTRAEIVVGLRKGEEEVTSNLFNLMECLKIDDAVGHKAGEYMKAFRASHSLEIADALIASTAFINNVSLWSLNKKHYPMKDIELFSAEHI